jgi:hypothetical protein
MSSCRRPSRLTPLPRPLDLALAVLALPLSASAAVWVNPDTSQFTSLGLNSPTAVNFRGTGDLTLTRTSEVGTSIVTDLWSGTFTTPVGALTNPAWVLGTRSYYDLSVRGAGSAGSLVSYEFQFAGGLGTTAQLVFVDFDWSEQVTIKAYDSANNLIPFANTTVLLSPGQDSTPRYQDISWAARSGATGLLRNTNDDTESNIIASISSSTAIHRLVYEFDFSNVDPQGATVRFSIAASVPDAAPTGALLGLALTGAAFRQFRRKRHG